MKKTYLNIYKKYLPYILLILIFVMIFGIYTRKKIYNNDFTKVKDLAIVIDNDKSDLSNLAKKVISNKNKVISLDTEANSFTYIQNGWAKAVYIIEKDFQKTFFKSLEENSRVFPKVIEHYGISREKTAPLSLGNLLQIMDVNNLDLEGYGGKYSKDEKGQKEFVKNLENQIEGKLKQPKNLNIDYLDFKDGKVLFEENKLAFITLLIALIVIIILSSKPRLKIYSNKKVSEMKKNNLYPNEFIKRSLKTFLPIDILLFNIYTLFIIILSWTINYNALDFNMMLENAGVYYAISLVIYLLTYIPLILKKEGNNE